MNRNWILFVGTLALVTGAAAQEPSTGAPIQSGGAILQISAPRAGSIVDGPDVVVSGYGKNGLVTVRVYRGSTRILNANRTVANGRWQTAVLKLSNGSYTATAIQGSVSKTVTFTVGTSKGFGFVSPGNGEIVAGPNVTFSGTADSGTVDLRVTKGTALVFRQGVSAQGGRWSMTKRLVDGAYKAEASRNGVKRTITFHVGSDGAPGEGGGIGGGNLPVDVEYPRDGSTVNGPTVVFSGYATGERVSVRIYDGDRVVFTSGLDVHNGRWSMTRNMSSGQHTIAVQQGDMIRTSKFNVRFGGPSVPVKPSDRVGISRPRDGGNVVGPRINFSGTATTTAVGVNIYQGAKRIVESSQKVVKGKWSFTTNLKKGVYRVEIIAGDSRATAGFKVK